MKIAKLTNKFKKKQQQKSTNWTANEYNYQDLLC